MKANEVGNVIKTLLLSSVEVTALVGQQVAALVVKSAAFPYITYRRVSVRPAYTKDRKSSEDTTTVDVTISAGTYEQSVEVLNAVFGALQGYTGTIEGIRIDEIRMINSEEDFLGDCYVQNMTFEIDIIND